MTNTAKVTKALRKAGFTVTTDMPRTVKVKKTRFQEETSVTAYFMPTPGWTSTINWKTKNEELAAKLIELGFEAVLTETNGIEISFVKVGA